MKELSLEYIRELAESGYCVRWRCLSAAEVGAPHKRDRVWIIAYSSNKRLQQTSINKKRQITGYDWWSSESGIRRVDDGMASGMERRKTIGKGQVPAVAALVWEMMNERS